jgi:hypothetical protein
VRSLSSLAPFIPDARATAIPLNDKLKGHLTAARIRGLEVDTAKDAAALQMLDLWRTRLAIRTVLAGIGWAAALCAVVLR